jgi:hypothetical protein
MNKLIWLLAILGCQFFIFADGLKDNLPKTVRKIPMQGIALTAKQQQFLQKNLHKLNQLIKNIEATNTPRLIALLPDVEIFAKAIRFGLEHREILFEREITWADDILIEGISRAQFLLKGQSPWTRSTGFVVRGFRSKIDQSVQPYGLIVPESYKATGKRQYRLDIWLHGRGEKQLELGFIRSRMGTAKDKFTPADTLVLHPYGRYSNAFKFAGEIDVLEALEHVKNHYSINKNLIANRGFSMGGAGCWQLAVHYSDQWFASNPGAGFSETADFLKVFQDQTLKPTWYEKVLWRLYDCPDKSVNLKQCPTIAYSGADDRQIQAARMMEKGHAQENMKLLHIIGPATKHKYHPDSAKVVSKWLKEKEAVGKIAVPTEVHFVTFTLKYNRMNWVRLDRLKQHFEKARIDAKLNSNSIEISTSNIDSFHLHFNKAECPLPVGQPVKVILNGQEILVPKGPNMNKSWQVHFTLKKDQWQLAQAPPLLAKKKDLQGPIDDAFMDSFIFVSPTAKSKNDKFHAWSESERKRGIKHWRQHFRGDAIVKNDTDISQEDIAKSNLILWGDADSNAIIKRIIKKLPIQWDHEKISLNDQKYNSKKHALIMVYPNPLNPEKYIVLNSSFTYREYAYLNNARQVPMLPDWAIIDLATPPNSEWPGKVINANFFDEKWELKK